jgi:hypothetical protein
VLWIKIELSFEPIPTPFQDVGALLFGFMRRLFLNVRPQRSKKLQSVARIAVAPRSAARSSSISLIVISGAPATSSLCQVVPRRTSVVAEAGYRGSAIIERSRSMRRKKGQARLLSPQPAVFSWNQRRLYTLPHNPNA